MPTIKQLPVATSVAGTDALPVSQSGFTRSVTVNTLLTGTQPTVVITSGNLLGRVSAGSGGPEPIGIGTGVALHATELIATGEDHIGFVVATSLLPGDEVILNNAGIPKRLQATVLRSLFSAGPNVQIDANGVISGLAGQSANLTPATSIALGGVKAGNGLSVTADGILAVAFGTSANTAVAGNDSRFAAAEQSANKGQSNGYASLDGTGRIPTAQLPASIQGALNYQGTWNANTNSPVLTSGVGTKGYYYTASTAGSTALDGISQWSVGDHATFNGTAWEKLGGIASEVSSVAGRSGAVVLGVGDVSGAAPLSSPAFTGMPTAPTAPVGTNTTQLATTAFVTAALSTPSVTETTPPSISGVALSSGPTYAMQTGDRIVDVTSNLTGAVSVTLPAAPTLWVDYTVIDGSRNASANNITLKAPNNGTINGLPTFVMNENADSISIRAVNPTTWRIV